MWAILNSKDHTSPKRTYGPLRFSWFNLRLARQPSRIDVVSYAFPGVLPCRAANPFLLPLCWGPEKYDRRCERSDDGQKKQWQQEPSSMVHRVLHLSPIAGDQ